jgi:hypothetical protein
MHNNDKWDCFREKGWDCFREKGWDCFREKGWDCFFPDPNTHDEMFCRVCGEKMSVIRCICGPTGYVEAIYGSKGRLHDSFHCNNSHEDWHKQSLRLLKLAEETPSALLEHIYRKEVEEILKDKHATKKV